MFDYSHLFDSELGDVHYMSSARDLVEKSGCIISSIVGTNQNGRSWRSPYSARL